MNVHDNLVLETDEPVAIAIEEVPSTQKNSVCSWLRRIVSLDDGPNQKHHGPVFIIIMSILHVIIYLLTHITTRWRGETFGFTLLNLLKLFVPCMRPTPYHIRTLEVTCNPLMINSTCYYDDELQKICSSFMYPHQLWRMVTGNLMHMTWYHLLANVSTQLLYGIALERKYGSVRLAITYWLASLGSSLCFMVKNRDMPSIGASGSVFGVMLFWLVDRLIAMRVNTDRRRFILWQIILLMLLPPTPATVAASILNLKVAHSAHFGGGLVGFLSGVGMLGCPWPWKNPHCLGRTTWRYIAFIFLFLYFAITLTIFFRIDAPSVYWILHNSR